MRNTAGSTPPGRGLELAPSPACFLVNTRGKWGRTRGRAKEQGGAGAEKRRDFCECGGGRGLRSPPLPTPVPNPKPQIPSPKPQIPNLKPAAAGGRGQHPAAQNGAGSGGKFKQKF